MVLRKSAEGYDEFLQILAEIEKLEKSIFICFSGSKDPATGKSWCPDCVAADPVIEEALQVAPEDAVYLYVAVGERAFWKDMQNPFRTDEKTKLTCVPTLLKWGTSARLLDYQCTDLEMVKMLFEE